MGFGEGTGLNVLVMGFVVCEEGLVGLEVVVRWRRGLEVNVVFDGGGRCISVDAGVSAGCGVLYMWMSSSGVPTSLLSEKPLLCALNLSRLLSVDPSTANDDRSSLVVVASNRRSKRRFATAVRGEFGSDEVGDTEGLIEVGPGGGWSVEGLTRLRLGVVGVESIDSSWLVELLE